MLRLLILVSLLDLQESAVPDEIFSNIEQRRYLRDVADRHAFSTALQDLLQQGYLTTAVEQLVEVEYAAYGLIQELCAAGPFPELTASGWARIQEAATYAAQIYVDEESWARELDQEKEEDEKRLAQEALIEQENALEHGYPYDILMQARQAKRGRTHIYVVLLDNGVRQKRGVRLGRDPTLPAVYVGLTGLSPQRRFQNHKAGTKAGRGYVRDYGLCLLPDLYRAYNPMPRKLAAAAEKALADKLRREGYTVLGGH